MLTREKMHFLCNRMHKMALEQLIALSGNSFKGNLEFIEEFSLSLGILLERNRELPFIS